MRRVLQEWRNADPTPSRVGVPAILPDPVVAKKRIGGDVMEIASPPIIRRGVNQMFFKRKSNIIFRNYGDFGYITDNRNFGYRQANYDIGDRVVSESGAIFLSVLSREPQELDDIVKKIHTYFLDEDIETITADAKSFYFSLEEDGFVVSGATAQECNDKDSEMLYDVSVSISENKKCLSEQGISESTQEFFDGYFDGTPQLTSIHMEIASECNERCIHCYIPHELKSKIMDTNLFYSILEQCKSMNVLHITISGGEPMLHPNFIDFLKKCNEYNFSVNILSNLTLLNDSIINEMKQNPLLSVQTSLYSMNPTIHDLITQKVGSFRKTKDAIMQLIKNNIPLQISCPILKQNEKSYHDVIEWGKANGIGVSSDFVIIGKCDHTTENLCHRLSISEIETLIKQKVISEPQYLKEVEERANRNIDPEDSVCSVCLSSVCISETGSVYPCVGWQDYILGNLCNMPLSYIWNNSKRIQYLRSLRRKDFPECIKCPDQQFCTMCMVRNANENPTGDPLIANQFFCKIANLYKKMVTERE